MRIAVYFAMLSIVSQCLGAATRPIVPPKPFIFKKTAVVAMPKTLKAKIGPEKRTVVEVESVQTPDFVVSLSPAERTNGIHNALSELAKKYTEEFVKEAVKEALGIDIPDEYDTLVARLRWLRTQRELSLPQIKEAIRAGSTVSRMRVVSTDPTRTSSPFVEKPGDLELWNLDVLLSADELLIAYKTCNSVSRSQCSLVMAYKDTDPTLARYEIGIVPRGGSCVDQYQDLLDADSPDCHCQHIYSNCSLACMDCTYRYLCTIPTDTPRDALAYYHRSSYLDRQCNAIPMNDLCTFTTDSGEATFVSMIGAQLGQLDSDIRLQIYDVDYVGATLCAVADEFDLAPLEVALDQSWELSGVKFFSPSLYILLLVYVHLL